MVISLTSAENQPLASKPDLLEKYLIAIAGGDTCSLEDLYRAVSSSVYSYALSILKNAQDAQDVMHDCFIAVYSSAESYTAKGKPMAWILTITKNLCLHKLRENKRRADITPEEFSELSCVDTAMSSEDSIVLNVCLERLSVKERQIVVLHSVSGFKHREISDFLNLPLSTVISKYNRALKKLNEILSEGEQKS